MSRLRDDISCHNALKESGIAMAAGRVMAGSAWKSAWCWRDSRAAVRRSSMTVNCQSNLKQQINKVLKRIKGIKGLCRIF